MKTTSESVYDLVTMSVPQLSGFLLRLFTWLAETFPSIARFTGKDSGIYRLRHLETKDLPTYYPFCAQTFMEVTKNAKALTFEEAVKILSKSTNKCVFQSTKAFHSQYLSLKTTPTKVCMALIDNLELDMAQVIPLNAMNKYNKNDILRQAEASTKRYADKCPIGPLDGIPIAIKDEMTALPYKTDVGTNFLNLDPKKDAAIVERLRKAGAIIIGKTNMHEFGLDVTGCNPHCGTPRNPYDSSCFAGGSSGGSAAIVASGICPISVGADGGGSIRIPAAYNGIYGLKATAGRISGMGSFPCAPTVGVVGPMAVSAHDLAISYMIAAGPNPEDPRSLLQPPPTIESFLLARKFN